MFKNHPFLVVLSFMLAAPLTLWAYDDIHLHDLTVIVKLSANDMPDIGKSGAYVLIYKKGDSKSFVHKREQRLNTGETIEIPFYFDDLASVKKSDLIVKVYGTTFNAGDYKLVDFASALVRSSQKELILDLVLKEIEE